MKSFRKLILAGVMLVFALVAVVSSTYAWFTTQTEAEVKNIELGAAASGKDLQVSTDGTNWGYIVDLADLTGTAKLAPVTFSKTDKTFNKIVIDSTEANKNKFKYDTASALAPGASTGEGYLVYDLYFKTSNSSVTELLFDTRSAITSTVGTGEILKTLRVMFVVGDASDDFVDTTTLVYEPNYTEDSTYGTGEYFKQANNYIAADAFTHPDLLPFGATPTAVAGVYSLDTTFATTEKYTTKTTADVTVDGAASYLEVGGLTPNTSVQVKVFVWLEGWDGDTTNSAASQSFTLGLKFRAN